VSISTFTAAQMSEPDLLDESDLALAWTQLPPGPELAIRLALTDWAALSDRELVSAMDAARRQTSWTQSVQLEAVGELSRRRYDSTPERGSDIHRRIAGEVSLELTVPTWQAEELLWLADALPDRHPHTWAALRTGQVDLDRAKVMADGMSELDETLARALDRELTFNAVEETKTRLRKTVKRAVRDTDPDAFADKTKRAKAERRVEIWGNADDTCDLVGRNMDAGDAHAIRNRLTAAAQAMKADGDTRPIDQIRSDLLRDLLRGIPLPDAVRDLIVNDDDGDGRDAVAADTDAAGDATPGQDGPHDASADALAAVEAMVARALADVIDKQLSRLLDQARAEGRLDGLALLIGQAVGAMRDGLSGLVDGWCRATGGTSGWHGHDGYRPPAGMQRLIQRRHATCVFPTCQRRSHRCDLDHSVPHDHGGRTCKCNLAPLCRAHHRIIKQHPSWTLVQPWPGLLVWVAPSGTWHIVTPQ
jgi:hypothetical protein